MNLYEYVYNSPTNWIDPYGLIGMSSNRPPYSYNDGNGNTIWVLPVNGGQCPNDGANGDPIFGFPPNLPDVAIPIMLSPGQYPLPNGMTARLPPGAWGFVGLGNGGTAWGGNYYVQDRLLWFDYYVRFSYINNNGDFSIDGGFLDGLIPWPVRQGFGR